MLGWELSVVTRLCKVSNPSLMLKRLFCSAEMWVILLVSVCWRQHSSETCTHTHYTTIFFKIWTCTYHGRVRPTLFDSIFPGPEKPECGDSGLEALSKGFGGDVCPGCAGKLTVRNKTFICNWSELKTWNWSMCCLVMQRSTTEAVCKTSEQP